MDLLEFKESLKSAGIPDHFSVELKALWYDGKGDWDHAHDIAQDITGKAGSHIHAYLHRKEGDLWNAGYWYRRAGQDMPDVPLEQEWEDLVQIFL